MRDLILLLGGARAGKTAEAVRRAVDRGGDVVLIATSDPRDNDAVDRVRRHRAGRPHQWTVVERHEDPGPMLAGYESTTTVILDCVTLWIANVLFAREREAIEHVEAEIDRQIDALLECCAVATGELIVVSNEVGLGVVPSYPLGRTYRDLLGRANRRLAAHAEEVLVMIAGIPVPIGRFRRPHGSL